MFARSAQMKCQASTCALQAVVQLCLVPGRQTILHQRRSEMFQTYSSARSGRGCMYHSHSRFAYREWRGSVVPQVLVYPKIASSDDGWYFTRLFSTQWKISALRLVIFGTWYFSTEKRIHANSQRNIWNTFAVLSHCINAALFFIFHSIVQFYHSIDQVRYRPQSAAHHLISPRTFDAHLSLKPVPLFPHSQSF